MTTLSKTARAAKAAGEREQQGSGKKEPLTIEKAVREIRNLRQAKLFVSNMEYVDKLLEGYDALQIQSDGLQFTLAAADSSMAGEMGGLELSPEDQAKAVAAKYGGILLP